MAYSMIQLTSNLVEEMKKAQEADHVIKKYKEMMNLGISEGFKLHEDGSLRY